MGETPSLEEVRAALFDMGPYKAPGFDGFYPIFYQSNWSIVGKTLYAFVKEAFQGGSFISKANKTLISLIPKGDSPTMVNHFRPISLCSVYYKCITKIITTRLRAVMDDLIFPFQASFVKGRHIQDNIIVGQEIIHIMRKARGRKGLMAMKIDLEKAFDRLKWEFVKQVLILAGFDECFVNLVMNCITSVAYNVLWNGMRTDFFFPKRGLHQGDPISPLLFILCMDRLSHIISDEVINGKWKPITVSAQGSAISHLMFADDLLLFGTVSEKQAKCMMGCLEKFCSASREKINKLKSSVFFSPKVSNEEKRKIKTVTGMHISSEIGKYLGFPLSRKRKPTETFQYIVDRVKEKLASWKEKCLSMAGRITLAKSVLNLIPLYPMLVSKIPQSICSEIEKLQRNFIWGTSQQEHGFHPIGWDQLTLPKSFGGLGFKKLSSLNRACGTKIAWQLLSGAKGLWEEVLENNYMLRNEDELLACQKGDSAL